MLSQPQTAPDFAFFCLVFFVVVVFCLFWGFFLLDYERNRWVNLGLTWSLIPGRVAGGSHSDETKY